jgi:hypothetical protein
MVVVSNQAAREDGGVFVATRDISSAGVTRRKRT